MAPASAANYGETWVSWTATTNTASVTQPWSIWCQNGTTAATTVTQTIWLDWTTANGHVYPNQQGYRQPTPEEQEARRLEAAERSRIVAAAKTKARQLLKEVLDRDQRRELEKDGHFHVQTRNGERVYRIKPGGQPERVKGEDGIRWSYCIHPRESYPADDAAAAFKLLIEADEDEFLRIANATRRGVLVNA